MAKAPAGWRTLQPTSAPDVVVVVVIGVVGCGGVAVEANTLDVSNARAEAANCILALSKTGQREIVYARRIIKFFFHERS